MSIAGVTSIIHTASPLNLTLKTRDETIRPAVQGTLSLLKSAHNCARIQFNNIVVTGSVASVMGIKPKPGKVYTEADFDETPLIAEQAGENASPNLLYYTSKILAEEALRKFVSNLKVSCILCSPTPRTSVLK
jgi:nucleoside-diphosphate-sugar epimerase